MFTAYDPGYRQIHKGSAGGGDEGNTCLICGSIIRFIISCPFFKLEPLLQDSCVKLACNISLATGAEY